MVAKLRVIPFSVLPSVGSKCLSACNGIYDVRTDKLVGVAFEVVSPILLNCNISEFLCDVHRFRDDTASVATIYKNGDIINIPLDDLSLFLGLPEFDNKADGGTLHIDISKGVDTEVISSLPKCYFNRRIEKVVIVIKGYEAFKYLL